MLETITIILLALWVLGLSSAYSMSGFLHVLLILAIIVTLIQIIDGRKIRY